MCNLPNNQVSKHLKKRNKSDTVKNNRHNRIESEFKLCDAKRLGAVVFELKLYDCQWMQYENDTYYVNMLGLDEICLKEAVTKCFKNLMA